MREAIEAWEAEGGGLREITEGAAEPSVVVYRRRPVSAEKRMIGTANQVDWAERIRGQVSEEFDRVAKALESAMSRQSELKRGETLTAIAILEDKRAEVMAQDQAGYFIREWQRDARSGAPVDHARFPIPGHPGEAGGTMTLKAQDRFRRSEEDRSSVAETPPHARWNWMSFLPAGLSRLWLVVLAAARTIRSIRLNRLSWSSGVVYLLICLTVIIAALVTTGVVHVYFDRTNLPDIGPFTRFEFPSIGHIYDANGQPLIELAREYRQITKYEDIPPIVRDAILATEDRNFFSHGGVDYSRIPRVLGKVRIGALLARLVGLGGQDAENSPAIFPQGGSTITQQLVRGHFLQSLTVFQNLTAQENSNQLRQGVLLPRVLSWLIGGRSANMVVRKLEEIRLSLWVETEMQARFGSKRRAKEEILARYASFIYMGNGQYGFARAAEYYFGRPLATFTAEDADKAALLAGIAKSPRDYAPSAKDSGRVLRRRNQTLALMAANGFISVDRAKRAQQCPIPVVPENKGQSVQVAAAVDNVLEELSDLGADLSIKDLLQGRIQVYSTVDARVQHIVNEALEHGLELYEKRHPRARGLVQGSVVVLRNRDASILAETGGRQFYADRSASYSDFNRVTESLRQPGSAMKPIVYLAAFRQGIFNLESLVPDEPISVPDGGSKVRNGSRTTMVNSRA